MGKVLGFDERKESFDTSLIVEGYCTAFEAHLML